MSVTSLTKVSKRSLRTGCPSCNSDGPFYRAMDESGIEHLVVHNTLTQGLSQGEPVPTQFLHTCEAAYNGTETATDAEDGFRGKIERIKQYRNDNPDSTLREAKDAIEAQDRQADDIRDEFNPASTPAPAAPVAAKADPRLGKIMEMMGEILSTPQLDETQIEAIIARKMDEYVFPTRTYVQTETETREIDGVTHKQFGDILDAIAADGTNVQLVGAPGVGKTHVCAQVADALGRQFYAINFHLQSTASELKGYMDATGTFVPTVVWDWATNPDGGVLLCDELDRAHAGILAALNSILSNRFITLPNRETVRLNENHVVLAATNTWGDGPTWEYPAAQKFSAEFKDRFIAIEIEIDQDIELAAAMAKGAPVDVTKRAVSYVQSVRGNVKREAISGVVVSPRASQNMAALLARSVDWDKAVAWSLRKGMDADTWRKVS